MLKIDQQVKDLGAVKFGSTIKFQYEVTNKYPVDVVLDAITPGCASCTKVTVRDRNLKVGQSTFIDVAFTPGSTGVQKKTISISYTTADIRNTGDILLTFKAISHG